MSRRTRTSARYRVAVALLVVLVLVVTGGLLWQLWWVPRQVSATADQAASDYLAACSLGSGADDIGLLQLPGASTMWPIRSGVDDDAMAAGVGWYPQTALPGQPGNMALVGRRLIVGGAFDGILNLNAGDSVTVETCDTVYTYTVVVAPRDLTVQPEDTWVLDPVPGSSGVMPTTAWLTLIANQDVLPSSDRAVGFASLTNSQPR